MSEENAMKVEERKTEEEMAEENNLVSVNGEDVVDYPPNDYIYKKRDVFFVFFGVVTLIGDWVSGRGESVHSLPPYFLLSSFLHLWTPFFLPFFLLCVILSLSLMLLELSLNELR